MSSDDLEKKIGDSIPEIQNIAANAELRAAQSARVQLELRTFSTGGTGVKDIHGNSLSEYSKGYKKKREKAGLQTSNKDLIFSSDTSVIKDNITVGNAGEKPALGFIKAEGAEIAGYQEKQSSTKIFQLNDSERETVKKDVKDYVMGAIRDMVRGWKDQ